MPFELGLMLLLLLTFTSPTSSCTEQEQSSLLDFLAQLSPEHNGDLDMSWVRGSISPSLGNLTRLLHLNLSRNSLSGGLPMDLLLFSSVAALDFSFNHLDGLLQEL
ncbi:hypothetical protein E2562_035462 [Oryza meyeriana var. granulata]|uniref:Leucine-rich repeat-containing N-terminal plant-type domain-containing protein n=1 Tax=Oryza meyeriana var. granulata TaxID=110450 RepID=A0A6G1CVS2_9ORYZ|nr:hypothetical protein E2562_035462 [Oryza meyeriana var. granulata]